MSKPVLVIKENNPQDAAIKITSSENDLEVYDHKKIVRDMLQFQVEYHLSDENLEDDNYLLSKMHDNKDYWLPISVIAELTKIKQITADKELIMEAIEQSNTIVLNEDKTAIKRPGFVPPKPHQHKHLRRCVLLYGLPPFYVEDNVRSLCKKYGKVVNIQFDSTEKTHDYDEFSAPHRDVSLMIMTKKFGPKAVRCNSTLPKAQSTKNKSNGQQVVQTEPALSAKSIPAVFVHPHPNPNNDPLDFSHLKTCFVVFESQSQGNKCVKGCAISSDVTGIRAMHQYDYIKCKKQLSFATANGVSPLVSPKSIGLTLNSPSFAALSSPRFRTPQTLPSQKEMALDFYLGSYDAQPPQARSLPHRELTGLVPSKPKPHSTKNNQRRWKNKNNYNTSNSRKVGYGNRQGKHFNFGGHETHRNRTNDYSNPFVNASPRFKASKTTPHLAAVRPRHNQRMDGNVPPEASPMYFNHPVTGTLMIALPSTQFQLPQNNERFSPNIAPRATTFYAPSNNGFINRNRNRNRRHH